MRLADLSPREREVAELLAQGLTCSEIALRLPNLRSRRGGTITRETVQNHVERIADRIGGKGKPKSRVVHWVLSQRAA
jgi:DNA-binding CsgD family transcriptional regulator